MCPEEGVRMFADASVTEEESSAAADVICDLIEKLGFESD